MQGDVKGTVKIDGSSTVFPITEAVAEEPAGGIYAEVVRELTTDNDPDFHANARLVR